MLKRLLLTLAILVGASQALEAQTSPGLFSKICFGACASSPSDLTGSAAPEGAVVACPGSTYRRTTGGSSTSLYVKEDAACDNSGWVAVGAGGGAATTLGFVTKTAEASLSNEFALGSLATGLLKNTTTTGVPTIAVSGTDYVVPAGNVATATALAANGANCSAGQFPLGVDASGAAETCTALPTTISGTANEIAASASTGAVTLSLPAVIDLGGKAVEIPNSTTLPGTCTVGQVYMDTDATTGQRVYACEASNTWTLQGDGGGGVANSFETIAVSGQSNVVADNSTDTVTYVAGSNMTITTNAGTDTVTFASSGGGGGSITQGTYASLPGTCTTGDLYILEDSFYGPVRCSATNTWSFFRNGKLVTLPGTVGSWTAVNAGSDLTASDATGAVIAKIDRNATLNWRGYFKTVPATPYTIEFEMTLLGMSRNSSLYGAYFYDGTKLMSIEILAQAGTNTLRIGKITNVTTDGTPLLSIANFFPVVSTGGAYVARDVFFRLGNNGSTLSFEVSFDRVYWLTIASEAVGTFITPTHYGFGGVNQSGTSTDDVVINLYSVRVQ